MQQITTRDGAAVVAVTVVIGTILNYTVWQGPAIVAAPSLALGAIFFVTFLYVFIDGWNAEKTNRGEAE